MQEYTPYQTPALSGRACQLGVITPGTKVSSGASQEEPQSKRQRAPDEPAQGAAEVPVDGADLLSTQVRAKTKGEEFCPYARYCVLRNDREGAAPFMTDHQQHASF